MPKLTPRQIAGRANRAKRKGITPEGRERLREAALEHKPWEHSTGPRTPEGKAVSRTNAVREGYRLKTLLPPELVAIEQAIRAAERGEGPLPPLSVVGAVAGSLIGTSSTALFLRGAGLMLRHQKLERGRLEQGGTRHKRG